ncbi:tripartite tricarboxylate transporter substrate binding protein [Variovorax sp. WS11]|uniref:Bug family tripartite tricarboxylate transporter substrate binding protein n=2 Tax=Variovorax sp. WS11 TaxID=1105204 RepID=UPI0015E69232|nr:tripartite tricarboxylate transporter substrate binding protein [Variovorax sp. WS11]
MKNKRALLCAFAAAGFLASIPTALMAQGAYPSKPIRAIVPFSPGGGTDTLARMVFKELSENLGRPIVIDNKPGAGGAIGWAEVARAPADGYTIGLGASTLPPLGEMYDSLPFDPKTAFEFVAPLATVPNVLVASAALPINNLADLRAYGRKTGPLAYGTPGVGTPQHLAGALFARTAGLELRHVPYRGTSNAMTDVLGDHIPLAFVGLPLALQYASGNRIKLLGVATSKRSVLAPDVPTLAEGGLQGYESNYWWDIIAPKGTPPAVLQKLYDATEAVLKRASTQKTLHDAGYEEMLMPRKDYLELLRQEDRKLTQIIRDNNIKLQGSK